MILHCFVLNSNPQLRISAIRRLPRLDLVIILFICSRFTSGKDPLRPDVSLFLKVVGGFAVQM